MPCHDAVDLPSAQELPCPFRSIPEKGKIVERKEIKVVLSIKVRWPVLGLRMSWIRLVGNRPGTFI